MIRQTRYRPLGEGQRIVLMLGTEGPVTRATLTSPGHKVALHGLRQAGLVDAQGLTTVYGRRALDEGRIPYEAEPTAAAFETHVRTLMQHWGMKRLPSIRHAIALMAAQVKEGVGEE